MSYRWDDSDARVVCRQLGYSGGGVAFTNSYYGEGSGPIWLDDVACHGDENQITYCGRNHFGHSNCRHSEDAGVKCGTTMCCIKYTTRLCSMTNYLSHVSHF